MCEWKWMESGNFFLQIFNRVAFVAIRVIKVKGYGRLQFTTQPCTHWSFTFYEVRSHDVT